MHGTPLRTVGFLLVVGIILLNGCKDSSTEPSNGTTPPPPPSGVVTFSGFVLPTFNVYGCPTCHGGSGGLTLTSYQSLMAGGNSGPVVIPGNGANSLIIRKLRGTAPGGRMPLGGSPLPDTTISTISAWIDQGALNN